MFILLSNHDVLEACKAWANSKLKNPVIEIEASFFKADASTDLSVLVGLTVKNEPSPKPE